MDVTAFFQVKTVYEGPGPVVTGLFKGPSAINFGTWENQTFTAKPVVVIFNTEKPPADPTTLLRPVIVEGVSYAENEAGQRFRIG